MAKLTNTQNINSMLLEDVKYLEEEFALFVHSSVFAKFQKLLNITRERVWDYELQVGNKLLDMKYIFPLTIFQAGERDILKKLIGTSKCSLPFESDLNLFTDAKSFYIIEQFLTLHRLLSYVIKIEDRMIPTHDEMITIVYFKDDLNNFDLIGKYNNMIYYQDLYQPSSYQVTSAFSWLHPKNLKHFHIPIDNDGIHMVFPIILNHLASLSYPNELSVFDLISLKLAFFDYRNPYPSNILENEIDYLIKRLVDQMIRDRIYIRNKYFDIEKYILDKDFGCDKMLIEYFLYNFQNYIESSNFDSTQIGFSSSSGNYTFASAKLTEHTDLADIIKKKSNRFKFSIDCLGFDRMSFSLFMQLLAGQNVHKLILDTNYSWLKDSYDTKEFNYNINMLSVHLIGDNRSNFIQDFVSSMTINEKLDGFNLKLNCKLADYSIFNDLIKSETLDELTFSDIQIDAEMLNCLKQLCGEDAQIEFRNCTIECKPENWNIFNESNFEWSTRICESENMWQSMFDFVSDTLIRTDLDEFHFKTHMIIMSEDQEIDLAKIKFYIDETKLKLQLKDIDDGHIIDLYDMKYKVEPNMRSDFQFYQ